MNLALKDGGVSLTVQLGTGKLDTAIKPGSVRFDDNAWHHVLVVRKSSEVFFSFFLNGEKCLEKDVFENRLFDSS